MHNTYDGVITCMDRLQFVIIINYNEMLEPLGVVIKTITVKTIVWTNIQKDAINILYIFFFKWTGFYTLVKCSLLVLKNNGKLFILFFPENKQYDFLYEK